MNRGTMGVKSLPKTVTRQRRACDFWTQALLRMRLAWVRFLVYNTGLVQYRWTGDLLTADRLKMQDWKIVNSSKYSLSCCTYVFHRCIFVLSFSVLAFSVAPLAMVKNRPHRTGHRGNVNTSREYGSEGVNVTCTRRSVGLYATQTPESALCHSAMPSYA